MAKIIELTAEQRARFPEFVEKWTKIGLSTEPADRPRAEEAITMMYRAAGLPPPKKIVWCGSPLSQGIVRAIIIDKRPKHPGDSVGASVGASVWDSVGASVGASVWASVGASVWASVGASVRASVWDSVRDSVWASVWDSVYGAHDASWLAFHNFFHDAIGLEEQTDKLGGPWLLAQSAGWAIPHQNICWVSERHHILERNERGQLHSVSGPAVAYPDGWTIYAVNGVRVPEFVIMRPQTITTNLIDAETNAEVRRVMIDRYKHGEEISGAAAYLRDAGGTTIDYDERWGTLRMREVPNDEPILMVEVVNRTREIDGSFKHYWLRVNPECRPLHEDGTMGLPQSLTAHAAVASTFGKRADEYCPEFES